jgi:hypothetical protein
MTCVVVFGPFGHGEKGVDMEYLQRIGFKLLDHIENASQYCVSAMGPQEGLLLIPKEWKMSIVGPDDTSPLTVKATPTPRKPIGCICC